VPSALACPRPACGHHGGGHASPPRDRCAAASCGSGACPPAPEDTPGGDSRTGGAPPPARAGVPQGTVVRPRWLISDHPAAHAHQAVRPTLAQPVMTTSICDGFPLGAGPSPFFLMSDPSAPHCRASPRSEASSASHSRPRAPEDAALPTRPDPRTRPYTCRRSPG